MSETVLLIAILVCSLAAQILAAVLALRLVNRAGRSLAWPLIAAAMALMALRRIMPMIQLLTGQQGSQPDLSSEIVGLLLSLLMAVGVGLIAPFFSAIKAAERKARAANTRLQRFSDIAIEGLLIHEGGRVIDVNKALLTMLGYTSAEEVIGKSVLDFIAPDSQPLTLERLESRSTQPCELTVLHKDGSRLTVDVRAQHYRYDGRTVRVAVVHDITQRKTAEQALQAEKLKLATVTRSIGAGLTVISRDYRVVWANDVIKNTFHGIEGQCCHCVFHQRDQICQDCGVKRVFEEGVPLATHEQFGIDTNGDPSWFQIVATPIYDDSGKVEQALELVVPINERKRAELELAERLRFEMLMAELSASFVSVRTQDLASELKEVLRKICECLDIDVVGLWQRSAAGSSDALLLTHRHSVLPDAVFPEQVTSQPWLPWWQRELMTGRSVAVGSINDLPAEATIERSVWQRSGVKTALVLPLKAAGDVVVGAISFCSTRHSRQYPDELVNRLKLIAQLLTSALMRQRSEQALRASEIRFRALSEDALVGVYMLQDDRLIYVNAALARMFGYLPAELIGANPMILVDSSDNEAVRDMMRWRESGELRSIRYEFRGRRKDGESICVEVLGAVTEVDGRSVIIGNIVDLTERRRLEEQFRQAQKMDGIGRLAGGIAHDFHNLLTVIQSFAGFIKEGARPGDPVRDDVMEIEKAADRAAALTSQLLAYSRRSIVKPQNTDLNACVTNIEKMLNRVLPETIKVRSLLASAQLPVLIDPGQLDQVLMNLAVNARDAMPDGGTFTIETDQVLLDEVNEAWELKSGPHVRMRVSDTGLGMSPEVMEHLFEPFFTTKDIGKGTGLGLSTVFGIVKQAGGHIVVSSEVGRGTSFAIYFPLASPNGLSVPAVSQHMPSAEMGGTVLLVDDELGLRKAIRRTLEKEGYTVLEAGAGAEALEICQSHPGTIDLMLTDLVMPGMAIKELVSRFRTARPQAALLLMTGFVDDVPSLYAVKEPGVEVIQKPFKPTALLATVAEVLRRPREPRATAQS